MKKTSQTKLLAYLALFITICIWGISAIVAKEAYDEIHPFTLFFLRFALASLLISPMIFLRHEHPRIQKKDLPKLTFLSFLLAGLGSGGWVIGLYFTTATRAAIITCLGPVLVVPLERWLLKRKESPQVYIGVSIGLIGTLLIIAKDFLLPGINHETGSYTFLGDMLILISAGGSALYSVLVQREQKRYHPYQKTALSFMVACLVALPLALFIYLKDPQWILTASCTAWSAVIYYAVGCSAIAFLLYQWAVEKTTPIESAVIFYLQPVITIIAAILILNETPTLFDWIGGGLVITGVIITTLSQNRKA